MAVQILIVEDTSDTREMAAFMLKISGFSVITASDGLEGLEKAKAEKPDLIITDLDMPKMDGVELIHQLRQLSQFTHTKIIVITAHNTDEVADARKAGANIVMFKPAAFLTLTDIVKELLPTSP